LKNAYTTRYPDVGSGAHRGLFQYPYGQRLHPSGAHDFIGITIGFAVLIFTAAYLYGAGFKFWVALLGGIAASVLLKLLFAYWRTHLKGPAGSAPGAVQFS
jgi:hypothetical protein